MERYDNGIVAVETREDDGRFAKNLYVIYVDNNGKTVFKPVMLVSYKPRLVFFNESTQTPYFSVSKFVGMSFQNVIRKCYDDSQNGEVYIIGSVGKNFLNKVNLLRCKIDKDENFDIILINKSKDSSLMDLKDCGINMHSAPTDSDFQISCSLYVRTKEGKNRQTALCTVYSKALLEGGIEVFDKFLSKWFSMPLKEYISMSVGGYATVIINGSEGSFKYKVRLIEGELTFEKEVYVIDGSKYQSE